MSRPSHNAVVCPKQPLTAVTFDLDGLMFNTEELYHEVGSEVLRRRGKTFTKDLVDQMMGRKAEQSLQLMIDWHSLQDTPETLAAESNEIFRDLLPRRLAVMPGLLELLDALERQGIGKGIATSSGAHFVTTVLGISQLAGRFEFVLTAEDIVHGKPAPDVYLLAALRHGVEPAAMLVLEDSQIGCAAACAAGAYVAAVPSEHSRHHQFPDVQLVAESLADSRIYDALGIRRSADPR